MTEHEAHGSYADVWVQHLAVGVMFLVTGWIIRTLCDHRGWLPHPRKQIMLAVVLLLVENTIATWLVH